jgi:hypothetical protein
MTERILTDANGRKHITTEPEPSLTELNRLESLLASHADTVASAHRNSGMPDPKIDANDFREAIWQLSYKINELRFALAAQPSEPKTYTEGHCANKKQPGGCQLHNLQCGYPDCDRRPVKVALPSEPAASKPVSDESPTFMGEPVLPRWKPLSRDKSRLALFQSMHDRKYGNPGDDKLMLEWLWEHGYALCEKAYAAAPPVRTLTDMDFIKLWGHRSDGPENHEIISFGRAIEAAIRSKTDAS